MSDKAAHAMGPYNPSVDVKNTFETALEKAIINNGFTVVCGEKIRWLDGELPVEAKQKGKNQYLRLDLLGLDSSDNYVLCELKFSGGDSEGNGDPADADIQLTNYARILREDGKWFRLHKNLRIDHKFDFVKFLSNPLRLMVVADAAYWTKWKDKNSHRAEAHRRRLSAEVEHYSIDISAVDFKERRELSAGTGRYEPELSELAAVWNLVRREDYNQVCDGPDPVDGKC